MVPRSNRRGGLRLVLDPDIEERIHRGLRHLYGRDTALWCLSAVQQALTDCAAPLPPEDGSLSEADTVLIAYADHLEHGTDRPLRALRRFAVEELADAFQTVHLLPFYPHTSDDGFSVSDYRSVNPDLGTWADVHDLSQSFDLMVDLVLNHTSARHPWFIARRARIPRYRHYYIDIPPDTDLSHVVRPRETPLLTARRTLTGKRHFWTTFSADQVDLNYANPHVLLEMLQVLLHYVEQGARFIRLDAVGFLWKEIGTSSIHHRKTHEVVQLLRAALDAVAPWVKLVTETNVPHEENVSYLSDGRSEAQMVYNFALPPLVLHTLHTGSAEAISRWAGGLSTPSAETTFLNFTASHDGVGLRGARDILSEAQIAALVRMVEDRGGHISYRTEPDGSASPYELNTTFFDALSSGQEHPGTARRRFLLSQTMALSLVGVPAIYLSSLFGASNWHDGYRKTRQNRTLNRQRFDLNELNGQLADRQSRSSRVFSEYRRLLELRRAQAAFHPAAPQHVLDLSPAVFALERTSRDEQQCILALHNVTATPVVLPIPGVAFYDLIGATEGRDEFLLAPYQAAWLRIDR